MSGAAARERRATPRLLMRAMNAVPRLVPRSPPHGLMDGKVSLLGLDRDPALLEGWKVAPVTDLWRARVETPGWCRRPGYRLRALRCLETKRSRFG